MSIKSTLEEDFKKELTLEEIKEFERELEDYKKSTMLNCSLDFYGRPLGNQERFNGIVVNEILGGVHWSVIDFCLKNKIMGKYNNGKIFIVAETYEREKQCITKAYDDFIVKWRELEKLKEKRLYAADMEVESFGGNRRDRIRKILNDGRQELNKKMGWK